MDARRILVACAFIGGSVAAGLASGLTAVSTPQDYGALEQPSWAPPSWLFGPVWTVLYACMGVAGFLLWRAADRHVTLSLWVAQFGLNLIWTPLFFGFGLRGTALVDISLLAGLLVVCMIAFWRRERRATFLFVPYLLWVSFATTLNAAIWGLNR